MDISKYEYQSDFAKHYIALGRTEGRAEGRTEGRTEGRAELLLRLLSRRFGPIPEDVRDRLATVSVDELDAIGERLLTANSLQEALKSA